MKKLYFLTSILVFFSFSQLSSAAATVNDLQQVPEFENLESFDLEIPDLEKNYSKPKPYIHQSLTPQEAFDLEEKVDTVLLDKAMTENNLSICGVDEDCYFYFFLKMGVSKQGRVDNCQELEDSSMKEICNTYITNAGLERLVDSRQTKFRNRVIAVIMYGLLLLLSIISIFKYENNRTLATFSTIYWGFKVLVRLLFLQNWFGEFLSTFSFKFQIYFTSFFNGDFSIYNFLSGDHGEIATPIVDIALWLILLTVIKKLPLSKNYKLLIAIVIILAIQVLAMVLNLSIIGSIGAI